MIRVVPTGDLGLDVLLGGGWRLVKRFEDKESATVIVRGGSGAGKTLVGIQAALELARALGGDVAVGCVEILPSEYIAQLQSARPSLAADRVARLPAHAVSDEGPRVYVALLQLETDQPDLVTALEQLDARVREAGGNPTAFIVDSLIDGYGIGSKIERIIADDVLRFAANYGRALVLCEETVSDEPSPWVFAADTVLQVGVESRERGRWIEVKKHRFGPSATGRHELELAGVGRPEVYPSFDAWRGTDVRAILEHYGWKLSARRDPPSLVWEGLAKPDGDRAHRGTLVVVGADDSHLAHVVADSLTSRPSNDIEVIVSLDPLLRVHRLVEFPSNTTWLHLPAAVTPQAALCRIVQAVASITHASPGPRILVGDLRAPLTSQAGTRWIDALRTLAGLLVDANCNSAVVVHVGLRGIADGLRSALAAASDVWIFVRPAGNGLTARVIERWPRAAFEINWERMPDLDAAAAIDLLSATDARGLD